MGDHSVMRDRAPAAEWRVRLYGDAAVVPSAGPSVALERRAAALLALATLEPGISRLRVATLLWPDSSDPRRNLRQQLLRFRQTFERELLVGNDTLRLAPDLVAEPDGQATGAPLLGTHDYSDCEDFAAWLHLQRETRRERRLAALRQQLADSEAAGDLDAALAAANALLWLDGQVESHHRELMRLHYLRGDNAAGLAAYRRLSDMLAADYGTHPSAASEQLAAILRANRQQHERANTALESSTAHQTLPVTLKRPPLLAGRETERAAALKHWAEGRAVLLEGEAGLGKSRLMAELLSGKGRALSAAGRPGDAGTPYATLARLLRPLLDGVGDGGAGLDASARDTLAHIAPVVAAAATRALPALRPGAMAAAVSALLLQRAVPVVALDDLHFADEATLELIAGLVAPPDPPRRWLLAARPAELSPAAQSLRGSLAELLRLGVVTLAGLDEGAIGALVDGLAIHGLQGSALAAPLWRHTGGNPMFVLETLKQGLADGSLARGELPRPLSVGSLIGRRLQRLSEPALTLARVAAIAGVDFSIELAESAIGVRAVQLASAWSGLQDAQVLRDESFAHDLVSDAVLRGVPQVVARRVHAQCAAWLSTHGGEAARVARHWAQAGDAAQAAAAFEQAAERALQASRRHEEAALHSHAAAQWALAGDAERRFEALAARVAALTAAAIDEHALGEASALLAQAGNDPQRLRAIRAHSDLLGQSGRMQEALAVGQPGLALAQRIGAHEEQVRIAGPMAANLAKLGRPEEAYSLLLPLREWVDSQGDDELRSIWHGYWAGTLGHIGRLREAVASYDIAIACAGRTGRRDAVGAVLLNQGVVLRTLGQLGRAFEASRRGLALMSDDTGATSERALALLMHARDQAETGRYADALRAFDEVMPQLEAMGNPFWPLAAQTALAALWLHLGQYARALQLLQASDAGVPAWLRAGRPLLRMEIAYAMGLPLPQATVLEARALTAGDRNRESGIAVRALRAAPAQEVLDQAVGWAEVARGHERFGLLQALHVHQARAATALARHDEAAAAARAALALLDQGFAPEFMYLPELHLVAGRALAAAGAPQEAQRTLQAGADWITQHALPQVPAVFIDAFLHRNPVNRELLAAAAAANGHG